MKKSAHRLTAKSVYSRSTLEQRQRALRALLSQPRTGRRAA